jgi:hypothetical protein
MKQVVRPGILVVNAAAKPVFTDPADKGGFRLNFTAFGVHPDVIHRTATLAQVQDFLDEEFAVFVPLVHPVGSNQARIGSVRHDRPFAVEDEDIQLSPPEAAIGFVDLGEGVFRTMLMVVTDGFIQQRFRLYGVPRECR